MYSGGYMSPRPTSDEGTKSHSPPKALRGLAGGVAATELAGSVGISPAGSGAVRRISTGASGGKGSS
jgi:hypothetical protein